VTLSLFTTRAADADEVAVVAAVTGYHGNATYARQLLEQDSELEETSRTENEDADATETTAGELDEETRRQLEAQIEELILPDTLEEIRAEKADEDAREKQGDGEISGEQELTEDAVAEEDKDEETAEGRTAAHVGAVTWSFA